MERFMMQQDLLDWPGNPGPNVHKNAKDTERLAAEFIAPRVTGLRLKALQSLASAQPGLTGSQVADKMDAWLYSVKPRLTELQNRDRFDPRASHLGLSRHPGRTA